MNKMDKKDSWIDVQDQAFRKTDIRFRLIIFGLLKAINEANIVGDRPAYCRSVNALEQNLEQYADEDYKTDSNLIKGKKFDKEKCLDNAVIKYGKPLKEFQDYEITFVVNRGIEDLEFVKHCMLYRRLMKVCHESNLLLDLDVDMDLKGDDSVDVKINDEPPEDDDGSII